MDGNVNSASLSKKDVRASTAEKLKGMLKDIDASSENGAKDGFCARTRIKALFDEGTFVEMGAYVRRKQNESEFEGVICGYGAIEGRLVFAFSQDSSRMKGAFDEMHARKITDVYTAAIKNGAPVVGIFDSMGAIVYDGVSALAAYGTLMKCVSDASGVIPQIAVIPGVCAGSAATVSAMFDFTVTVTEKTKLYVGSPFLLGDKNGSAEFASENGLSAKTVSDEAEAYACVRELLSLLPQNNAEGTVVADIADDLARKVSVDAADMRGIVELIGDSCRFFELYSAYAPELITGFTAFGGLTAGVIANNAEINDGALTAQAARKAARFVSFCDSFGIPLVTLVNSRGLDISENAEKAPYASELAKLAFAYTSSENAKVTVVCGKAFGAAYTLMGSKSVGADIAFALDSAEIGVLPPESAVAFVWNDRVDGAESREALEKQWTEICSSPVDAAEKGEIDDIIDGTELRARICAALSMLSAKSEIYPDRRHHVLPL